MESVCQCCKENFEKKDRGYMRTGLHSRFKGGTSAAETLEQCFNIDITPEKAIFICSRCSQAIKSVGVKTCQLKEVEEKFRKIRKPGSYVTSKFPVTPTHRRTPKRVKVVSSAVSSHKKTWTPKKSPATANRSQRTTIRLPNTRIGKAVQLLNQSKYRRGLKTLLEASKSARQEGMRAFAKIIRKEIQQFVRGAMRTEGTFLSRILTFNWEHYLNDARKFCPTTLEFVTAAVTTRQHHSTATKKKGKRVVSLAPVIGLVLFVMAYTRNRQFNHLQQMISMMVWLSGCKRVVFSYLNHLGLCQSLSPTRKLVDNVRLDFGNTVKDWKDKLSKTKLGIQEEITENLPELGVWEDIDIGSETSDTDVPSTAPQTSESEEQSTEPPSTKDETTESTASSAGDSIFSEAESNASISDSGLPVCDVGLSNVFYDITFDNINQKIGVRHHVRGKKSAMLNMVQSYATLERTHGLGLSETIQTGQDILSIPLSSFLPSPDDQLALKDELSVLVARIITTYMPAFEEFFTMASIPHEYSKESAQKSNIVPLGILSKDETKVSDMIEILEHYSQYVSNDEHAKPVKTVLFCDGLSCERAVGAQRARINGEDSWARLDMFEAGIQEWHNRLIYIQDTYDELFNFESHRDKGTLYNIKQWFDHTSVSKNIMLCFDKADELLDFVTHCYVILYVMECCQLNTIDGIPKDYPEDKSKRIAYLNDLASRVVDYCFESPDVETVLMNNDRQAASDTEYCVCRSDIGGMMIFCNNPSCKRGTWFHLQCIGLDEDSIPEGDWFCSPACERSGKGKRRKKVDQYQDGKLEYVKRLMWRGLNNVARHDGIRENDGNRMIRHWKFDMINFHEKNHPKYFIFGHRLLANVAGATSERLAHHLKWERTVNLRGGSKNNVPKDLHCEHLNREYKDSCRVSCGQLTEESINRHSQMLGIGRVIRKAFEEKVVVQRQQIRKRGQLDRTKELKEMVQIMHKQKLFVPKIGRFFKGFEAFSRETTIKRPQQMKEKLLKHLKTMATVRELEQLNT